MPQQKKRWISFWLTLAALTATTQLEAREVLRYSPPEGTGWATVSLRTDSGLYEVAHGVQLADGAVLVKFFLDSAQTSLTARVDVLDAAAERCTPLGSLESTRTPTHRPMRCHE